MDRHTQIDSISISGKKSGAKKNKEKKEKAEKAEKTDKSKGDGEEDSKEVEEPSEDLANEPDLDTSQLASESMVNEVISVFLFLNRSWQMNSIFFFFLSLRTM